MKRFLDPAIQYFSRMWPFIGLLAVVSLVARSIFLTKSDVWHDEGFSAMIINEPIGEIIARTVNDVHPPFYYIVLHIWQTMFGASLISLRGFSVVCGVATVVLLYMLLRKLFDERIAKIGALFAALGPFLVRYSDEMRMYSLAALLAVASAYLLVMALQAKTSKKWLWWIGYGLVVAAGLYTQYFFVLLVPVHVAYALYRHGWNIKRLLADSGWWIGNIVAGGLFLLWLPTMLAQFSRVQQGFWIPPMSLETIPNTISHFMVYSNVLTPIMGYTLLASLVLLPLFFRKKQKAAAWLLVGWLVVPIIAVTLLSITRPVYIDRYFTYSAPAFYALLAVLVCSINFKRRWQRSSLIVVICGLFIAVGMAGLSVTGHQMGRAAAVVNEHHRKGDKIVSAELYTYFDFSYYNRTGQDVYLLSSEPFGKYGEYSLLHDKPHLRVADLADIDAERVWVVGKTGEHDYFSSDIPPRWKEIPPHFEGGDSVVRLYQITKR